MIVLDTNALMMPVECDVRLFEELDRVTPRAERRSADGRVARDRNGPSDRANGPEAREQTAEPRDADGAYVAPTAVRAELTKLADGAGTEATAAAVGLDLLKRCSVAETDADYADDAVLELAAREDATHAVTNDKPLKRRLLDAGVPVISLRGGNKLGITQP